MLLTIYVTNVTNDVTDATMLNIVSPYLLFQQPLIEKNATKLHLLTCGYTYKSFVQTKEEAKHYV